MSHNNIGRASPPAPRVGLVTPYFPMFEKEFPADFRNSQRNYADSLAALLRTEGLDVAHLGLVDSESSGRKQANLLADTELDVLVIAPTMAAPPSYSMPIVDAVTAPLLVWTHLRSPQLRTDFSESEFTRDSGPLGSLMLAGVLRKRGRNFVTVETAGPDSGPITQAVRAAAAAGQLRGLRIGILGEPTPGYLNVEVSDKTVELLGLDIVRLPSDQLSARLQRLDPDAVMHHRARLASAGIACDPTTESPAARKSVDVSAVLEQFALDEGLGVLVVSCHTDFFRYSRALGVVACLAGSYLASVGVPTTCTGDIATGIAMAIARLLAGSAQYCEPYTYEKSTDTWLLGSCGIANPRCMGRLPLLPVENQLYPGHNGCGSCFRGSFRAGPATIIGFADRADSPPRLCWLTGELQDRAFPGMNGASGAFVPEASRRRGSFIRWIDSGPAHHLALSPSDLSLELGVFSPFTEITVDHI